MITSSVWHLIIAALFGVAIVAACRWVRAQSRPLAALMMFGIAARAALGVTLFWISYLDLPLLKSLHSGDGFWVWAPDARTYFRAAAIGSFDGLAAIPDGVSVRIYVSMLAVWMRLVGASPVSAVYLNVGLYVLLCALVVRACRPGNTWRSAVPCLVSLTPFSVAPVLLIHGSQPLTDETFVFFIAVTCLALLVLERVPPGAASMARWPVLVTCLAAFGVATYGMSDIRYYYVIMVLPCLLLSTVLYIWSARRIQLGSALIVGLATLIVALSSYSLGRGQSPMSEVGSIVATNRESQEATARKSGTSQLPSSPSGDTPIPTPQENSLTAGAVVWNALVRRIVSARGGFARSGGNTNLLSGSDENEDPIGAGLVGLAVTFVPISIVKAMGWASFEGGRGFLFVTDIDTVFLDLSILGAVGLLIARRKSIGPNAPYVCYALGLALLTTFLLAFVVTNFGTLFRLRLLMAVPFWMLPLAIADSERSNRPAHRPASKVVPPNRRTSPSAGLLAVAHIFRGIFPSRDTSRPALTGVQGHSEGRSNVENSRNVTVIKAR